MGGEVGVFCVYEELGRAIYRSSASSVDKEVDLYSSDLTLKGAQSLPLALARGGVNSLTSLYI